MDVFWQFIKDHAAAISAIAAVAAVLVSVAGILVSRRKREDRRLVAGVHGKKLKSGGKLKAHDKTGRGLKMEESESANDMELSSVPPPEKRSPKG